MAAEILRTEYRNKDDWVNLHSISEQLWNQHGDPLVLADLGRIYAGNHVAPSKDIFNGQPVRVLVHAYNAAAAEYEYSSFHAGIPNEAATFAPRYETESFLARTSQHLSPQEHLAAEQLARELLQDDENCCIRLF